MKRFLLLTLLWSSFSFAIEQQPNTCPDSVPAPPFSALDANYQPQYQTIAHQFLKDEQGLRPITGKHYAVLEALITEARSVLPRYQPSAVPTENLNPAKRILQQIDCLLLRHGFVYPGRGAVQLLSQGLEPVSYQRFQYLNEVYRQPHNIRRRRFIQARHFGPFYIADCDILAFLYLAIAEVLHYPIYLVDIPNHIFVRWELGNGRAINYETMDGLITDDAYYQKRWAIPATLLTKGGILRSMRTQEALGYHDAAVAESWSWQHNYQKMRYFYQRSVQRDATRPFALHNMANYYLSAGRNEPESKSQALHYAKLAATVFPSSDNLATLACAYAQTDNWQQALRINRQAISINYAPFETDFSSQKQGFIRHQPCVIQDFGIDLTPFYVAE